MRSKTTKNWSSISTMVTSNSIGKVLGRLRIEGCHPTRTRPLERTDLEVYATSNFEKDVIDMLRLLPNFSIPFQKFIPSYQWVHGLSSRSTMRWCICLAIILVINVKFKRMGSLVWSTYSKNSQLSSKYETHQAALWVDLNLLHRLLMIKMARKWFN